MKTKFNYNKDVIKDNIEGVLQQSTLSIYKEAKEWYPKAHEYAVDFANTYNKPVYITAGIIAVLSPQKAWWHNLELTEDFLKRMPCRHVGTQVSKAQAIYDFTENYIESEKLPFIERMIGGLKTRNFFRNILEPSFPEYVTIDNHMIGAMTGDFKTKVVTDKQYNFLKGCLIEYSNELKMIPSELQSVIWLTTKELKKDIFGRTK